MSDEHNASRNRVLLIGAGVAAALAVAMLVVPALFGGDDATELPIAAPPAATAPPVEDAPELTEPDALPETFEVFSARDPFQQLVATGETSAADPTSTAAPPTAPAPSAPADATTTPAEVDQSAATGGDQAATPAAGEPVVGATSVRLVDVNSSDGDATVAVNGVEHQAGQGEVFAQSFRVLDVDGDCATLLFGDSRFSLCEGESIAK